MRQHIFIPIEIEKGGCLPVYQQYLKEWRENVVTMADQEKVSASNCHQAVLIELVLEGRVTHDWLGIMNELLMENGVPTAYSFEYSKQLHKFNAQYKQSSIHAIYTKWWLENLVNKSVDHSFYAALISAKKQSDGLFYDKDISETILRHRMKTELTLSAAMSIEILQAAGQFNETAALELATDLTATQKCPPLGYLSMEYFRLKSLELLNKSNLFPVGIEQHVSNASEGLSVGWCDFAMKSKVDAYMGTAKRTQRDKPIHSPLIACYVAKLAPVMESVEAQNEIVDRLNKYAAHLESNPNDLPAFQMRDIPINFGTDKTPIEVICASSLIGSLKRKEK